MEALEHVHALLSITPGPHSNMLVLCYQSRLGPIQTCSRLTFDHAYSLLEHTLAPLSTTPIPCSNISSLRFQTRLRSVVKPAHRRLHAAERPRIAPDHALVRIGATRTRRKTATRRETAPHRETVPRHSKPFSTSRLTQQFGCVEIPKTTLCISTRLQTFGIGKLLGISLSRDRFSSTFAQINSSSRVPLLC